MRQLGGGFLLLILAYSIGFSENSAVAGDEEWNRKRFLSEYEPYAKLIEQNYSNIEVTFTATTDRPNGNLAKRKTQGRFNRLNYLLSGSSELFDKTGKKMTRDRPPGEEAMYVRNRLYAFTVYRKQDGPWTVKQLDINSATSSPALCELCVPYADAFFLKKTYLEIGQDQTFHLTDFSDFMWHDKPVKRLAVEFTRPGKDSGPDQKCKADYFFLPENHWVCTGLKAEFVDGSVETDYRYEPSAGEEYPPLKYIEVWSKNEKQVLLFHTLTEINDSHRSPPFPEEDFRLTAFGIPEPAGINWQKPTSWYLLLGGAGVACLVITVLLSRKKALKSADQRSG